MTELQRAARELHEYVNRSGGLQESGRIQAWRRIYALVATVRDRADESEVAA